MRVAIFIINVIMAAFVLGITVLSASHPNLFCEQPGNGSISCCQNCKKRLDTCTDENKDLGGETKCFALYEQCNENCGDHQKK